MDSLNIKILQTVASGLDSLVNEVVFVGGIVTELYVERPATDEIRPTNDVDCIIEISSRVKYAELESLLRSKGFQNDLSPEAPICRWLYKDIKVDIMPTEEEILGFSNRWYLEGIKSKRKIALPNGTEIFIFSVEYYLASKIEAHKNRGGTDLRQSHDFEDIVFVLDNNDSFIEKIGMSNKELKSYLYKEISSILNNPGFLEGIETALPIGSSNEHIKSIKNKFAVIKNVCKKS